MKVDLDLVAAYSSNVFMGILMQYLKATFLQNIIAVL